MRILIITNYPAPYKVELFHLLGLDTELTVLYEQGIKEQTHRDNSWFVESKSTFKEIYLHERNGIGKFKYDKQVANLILERKYDFIINYEYSSPTGIYATYIMRRYHIPYILAADGAMVLPCSTFKTWIKKWEIKGAAYCFSPCELTDQYFLHYGAEINKILRYDSSPIKDQDVADSILSEEKGDSIKKAMNIVEQRSVFCACQFIYRKGLDILFQLANRFPQLGFYLAGNIEPDKFTKAVIMKGVPDNIHLLGFLKKDEMKKYYQACDFFIIPTRYDPWPSVLVEAMAQGQPVISSDMSVYAHKFIKNNVNGYIAKSEDVEDFEGAIKKILMADISILRNNALEAVRNYTIENSARLYLKRLNQLKPDIKILIAHPGRQHSYKLAAALKIAGIPFQYATTVYNKESSIYMKVIKLILKNKNLDRAKNRKSAYIEDREVIQFCELLGLIQLLIARLNKRGKLYNLFSGYVSRQFQKAVARYTIKNQIDLLILFDAAAIHCFDIVKKRAPHVIRIIDNAQAPRYYLHKIYNENRNCMKEFEKTFQKNSYVFDTKIAEEFRKESLLAEYHIAASSFTAKGLKACGIPKDKIYVVPYGVDTELFQPGEKDYTKLKVLFVGDINQRKGICQILEAAKVINRQDIEFILVGSGFEQDPFLYQPYEPYVRFFGSVLFHEMQDIYKQSSIFIFPVMGEGFGLVLLEALSSGLPVICTKNCAGNDLIQDGVNGFLIDVGDEKALTDKIIWFQNNQVELRKMSKNARQTALNYTWERYNLNIKQIMEDILKQR